MEYFIKDNQVLKKKLERVTNYIYKLNEIVKETTEGLRVPL